MRKLISVILSVSFLALMIISCGDTAEVKSETIVVDYGEDNFVSEMEKLNNPRGMLPVTSRMGAGYAGIIKKTPNDFYEYFVFDENTVLAVLSISPLYYVKISSPDIAIKFAAEYNQFLNNIYLDSASKKINSPFEFIKAGRNEVAVAFTPTEMSFSTETGEIILNQSDNFQVGQLLLDSVWAAMYVPIFGESVIWSELLAQRKAGKKKIVYANKSDFFPRIDAVSPSTLNFPFMYMKSGDSRGDYIVLFSNPLGDSADSDGKNYLSSSHGFAVILRADKNTSVLPFLNACGFDFSIFPEVAKELNLKKVSDNEIVVSWTPDSTVIIQRQAVTNPVNFSESNWVTVDTVTGYEYADTSISPGYQYYYRLCSPIDSSEIVRKHIIIPKEPDSDELVFTELVFIGSLQADAASHTGAVKRTSDRWFEIKNVSDRIICLDKVSAYYNGNLIFGPDGEGSTGCIKRNIYPGHYFVVANTINYTFSEMVIMDIAIRTVPSVEYNNPSNVFTMDNGSVDFISTIPMEGDTGSNTTRDGVSCFQSKVLLMSGEWGNSLSDFCNINPLSAYSYKNFCTPGTRAIDNTEY